tara:strand:+ start:448 stop:750 length:303 start_codon:yes stop_codon:yes gene_type:complete
MSYLIDDIEKGFVQIEDGPPYECYFPKTRQYWNGWAVPVGLTAKSLVEFIRRALVGQETAYEIGTAVELLTSIRPHQYGDLTVYAVGDGLIWSECTQEGG